MYIVFLICILILIVISNLGWNVCIIWKVFLFVYEKYRYGLVIFGKGGEFNFYWVRELVVVLFCLIM